MSVSIFVLWGCTHLYLITICPYSNLYNFTVSYNFTEPFIFVNTPKIQSLCCSANTQMLILRKWQWQHVYCSYHIIRNQPIRTKLLSSTPSKRSISKTGVHELLNDLVMNVIGLKLTRNSIQHLPGIVQTYDSLWAERLRWYTLLK